MVSSSPAPETRADRLPDTAPAEAWWHGAAVRAASLAVVLLIWHWGGAAPGSLLLPTPGQALRAAVSLVGERELWQAVAVSNQALALGYLTALAAGIPLGIALARWPGLQRGAELYLNLLLVVPMAAVIPIVIVAIGLGLAARAAVVFLFALPVIVINAEAGVRAADRRLIEMGRAFCADELALWRAVLLPGAVPAVVAGLRLGLGRALSGMVVVELLMIAAGVGRLILTYQGLFQAGSLYAVILVLVLQAVVLMALLAALERRAARRAGLRVHA